MFLLEECVLEEFVFVECINEEEEANGLWFYQMDKKNLYLILNTHKHGSGLG